MTHAKCEPSLTMKILFLTRSLEVGGTERRLVQLATGLHLRGHAITVAEFYEGGALEDELNSAGIPLICLKKRNRWNIFSALLGYHSVLRRLRPEVVHSFLAGPNILVALGSLVHSGIRTVWSVAGSERDTGKYDFFNRVVLRLEGRFSKFADLIVSNSAAGKAYAISNGFPSDTIFCIRNGFDTRRFTKQRASGKQVRKEWGIHECDQVVGLVARIDPTKDHTTFLKAAAIVHTILPRSRFVCIGGGRNEDIQALKQLSIKLGISEVVLWTGTRSDLVAVYNALDVLCLSSETEGLPNVVGEAMACQIPCVVTDVGDAAVVVDNTGLVVPKKDPGALADGIVCLLGRDLNTLGQKARARIIDHFSLDNMIVRTEKVFHTLLSQR